MARHPKTPADYGQLSLFEESVPLWLAAEEPPQLHPAGEELPIEPEVATGEDDDLNQFNHWLRQNRRGAPP